MDSQPISSMITLKLISQDRNTLFYKVNCKTPLMKLMKKYCKKRQVEYGAMQFFYDGDHIGPSITPEELLMSDQDEIEVFMHQTGGGCEEF